jgi:hypothetical protein
MTINISDQARLALIQTDFIRHRKRESEGSISKKVFCMLRGYCIPLEKCSTCNLKCKQYNNLQEYYKKIR